jgi:histidine triad (HIT) family protein
MDCIFCKIINKEIPSSIIYEDDNFLCFLDIAPNTRGHSLVIPKQHTNNFTELDNNKVGEFAKLVHKLAPQIVEALGADGYNLGLNNGAVAGQVVEHVHWHIIPRYTDDGLKHWEKNKLEATKLDETFNILKDKIK